MSLQLDYMKRALADVQHVRAHSDETVQKAYGGLCHQVPVFVLTHGLCITATFVDAKAAAESGAGPYTLMQRHLIGILGGNKDDRDIASVLARRPGNEAYMLDTFTILDAWIYYKRFAVSILDVTAADAATQPEAPVTAPAAQPAGVAGGA
jgi:CRISPR-associated protein Cmr5